MNTTNLINLVTNVIPISIVICLVINFVLAIKLYISAPEKNDIGFNKYWNTLMMDASIGNGKNLLIYDNDEKRYRLFIAYRIVTTACLAIVGGCTVVVLIVS